MDGFGYDEMFTLSLMSYVVNRTKQLSFTTNPSDAAVADSNDDDDMD